MGSHPPIKEFAKEEPVGCGAITSTGIVTCTGLTSTGVIRSGVYASTTINATFTFAINVASFTPAMAVNGAYMLTIVGDTNAAHYYSGVIYNNNPNILSKADWLGNGINTAISANNVVVTNNTGISQVFKCTLTLFGSLWY